MCIIKDWDFTEGYLNDNYYTTIIAHHLLFFSLFSVSQIFTEKYNS